MLKYINIYGFWGFLRLVRDLAVTKLYCSACRILRVPFYIRGKRFVEFGKGLTTGVGLRVDAFVPSGKEGKAIVFGTGVQLNDYVHIAAIESVRIGNNVLIASKVFVTDHNHGSYGNSEIVSHPDTPPVERQLVSSPVVIEDNVWLGEYVVVLPGVTIGKGAIVGAHSVVNSDIPPHSIAVGSPAKVVKVFNSKIERWERVS